MISTHKLLIYTLLFIFLGCSSKTSETYDTQVSTPITKFHRKIEDFAQYLNNNNNIEPIRVITNNMTLQSHASGEVLPQFISTVVQSTLLDFGKKIEVVTSCKKEDKRCYRLYGAITAFDDGIKVDTSSLNSF